MRASTDRHPCAPFVIGSHDLQRLDSKLREASMSAKYTADCSDQVSRTFSDLPTLLDYENPPSRAVRCLSVSARDRESDSYFRLRLDNAQGRNVFLNLEGPEPEVVTLAQAVDDLLSAAKPGYALLARLDYYWPALLLFLLLYIGPLVGQLWRADHIVIGPMPPPRRLITTAAVSFAMGCMPVFAGAFLNRIRRNIFPMGVFLIGQGEGRQKRMDVVRIVVIGGLLISMLGSLVVAVMLSH